MYNPCCIFAIFVNVSEADLEEDVDVVWSREWGRLLNLAKFQRLISGAEHRENGMGNTAGVSQAYELGVTITKNFNPTGNA